METPFQARAWAVARELLRVHTVFTALFAGACSTAVALLFAALLGWLAQGAGRVGASLAMAASLPLVSIGVSPILARYVIGAQAGDPAAGFFGSATLGETFAYAARYAALAGVWGSAYALAAIILVLGAGAGQSESAAPIVVAVVTGALALQLPCALVAAHATSVREAFSREVWRWLFVERLRDLPVFAGALLGAGLVFCTVYGVLFGLCLLGLSVVFVGASLRGIGASPFGFALLAALGGCVPYGAILVLTGRLTGAFAAGDLVREEPKLVELARGIPPDPALPSLHAVRALASGDVDAAIAAAEEARAARPRDAQLAAELARLCRRAGSHERARAAGAQALEIALEGGENALAVELYDELVAEREALALGAEVLEKLGRVLLHRTRLADATWCVRSLMAAGASGLRAQKLLIAVADALAVAGDAAGARSVYELLLREHPDTGFADYVRQQLDRLV